MSNVDVPDLFALRAEIADLTTRAAEAAAAMEPLIVEFHRVGDAMVALAEAGGPLWESDSFDANVARYEDWRKLTGYDQLAEILIGIADELNR